MSVSDGDRLSIDEALALDDEALLEELGAWLLGTGPGFGPSDVERKIRFAQGWLAQQRAELQSQICGEVLARLEHGGFDAMTDAAIVADAVATAFGKPPANIVAVILLRNGIRKLCEE
jgi:hypothetical protein